MVVTEFRDRHPLGGELDPTSDMTPVLPACAVVGHGRLGTALAAALRAAGASVDGPLGRGATASTADVVFLAVPDAEIADAAARIAPGRLVGHCSGATTLAPLHGHPEAFSLHPLMTVTAAGADFTGATAAIAGTTDAALRHRAHPRHGARHGPRRDRRRRPPRLPRRRLDGLQLPRHARVGRRARRRPGPRRARAARARDGRQLGRRRRPRRAHRARSPAATRPPSASSAPPSPSARPSSRDLFDALADATRELAGTRAAA